MTTTYSLTCPQCGQQCVPVVSGAQSAPWLCGPPVGCGRGWWPSELADPTTWNPLLRCHHHDAWPAVAALLDQEAAAAWAAGSSVVVEQVPLLTVAQLTQVRGQVAVLTQVPAPTTTGTTAGTTTTPTAAWVAFTSAGSALLTAVETAITSKSEVI